MTTRSVTIGGTVIGGGAPVRVESMLKSRLDDTDACVEEISRLASAGCELARVAYPSPDLLPFLATLVSRSRIPLMADIHFNYKLALEAIGAGVPSIRINPGNMTGDGLYEVLRAAKDRSAAIRIGANGGSLSAQQRAKAGGDAARALADAVEEQLTPLLDRGFEDVIISAKSSDVVETIRANELLSARFPSLPLHIGVTELGVGIDGAVKGAVGIGVLLAQGIGDTIRVSLTGPSWEEVPVGYAILRALGIRERGVNFISCPGCGRRRVDVLTLAEEVRAMIPDGLPDGFTVAVMGCEVNGPKEAAHADVGVAGTQGGFALFVKGEPVATGDTGNLKDELRRYLGKYISKK